MAEEAWYLMRALLFQASLVVRRLPSYSIYLASPILPNATLLAAARKWKIAPHGAPMVTHNLPRYQLYWSGGGDVPEGMVELHLSTNR